MLPDGAEERLLANADVLADACRASGVQQWDLIGFQSYGHQLDIEAGKITMAAGGGEGGFGVSYKVQGNSSNPRVLVNPLSILTPGVFRKIFNIEENGNK